MSQRAEAALRFRGRTLLEAFSPGEAAACWDVNLHIFKDHKGKEKS
jgi:hypothetical protein